MDIKEIRNLTNLSRAAFSRQYEIPIRTLEDWESEKRTPPQYVVNMLERIIKEDLSKMFYVIENKFDGFEFNENVVYSGNEADCREYENSLRKTYKDTTKVNCWTESAMKYTKNREKDKLFEEFKKGLSEEELKRTIEINGKKYNEAYVRFLESIGF